MEKRKLQFIAPAEIEARSMERIEGELREKGIFLKEEEAPVIRRVIHTSADFDYAETLHFSPGAVTLFQKALQEGADIVTDTEMAKAGINKKRLAAYGGRVHCFMGDAEVEREAKARGITRAAVSMERAASLEKPCLFAIGNAPTALIRLYELLSGETLMIRGEAVSWAAPVVGIIAVPVGFVNVVEAKQLIETLPLPHIVARGRKGGSNVAAAICNALLYGIR